MLLVISSFVFCFCCYWEYPSNYFFNQVINYRETGFLPVYFKIDKLSYSSTLSNDWAWGPPRGHRHQHCWITPPSTGVQGGVAGWPPPQVGLVLEWSGEVTDCRTTFCGNKQPNTQLFPLSSKASPETSEGWKDGSCASFSTRSVCVCVCVCAHVTLRKPRDYDS